MSHGVCGQPAASQCKPVSPPDFLPLLVKENIAKDVLWGVYLAGRSLFVGVQPVTPFLPGCFILSSDRHYSRTWSIVYLRIYRLDDVFTCGAFRMGVNANHPTRLFAVSALMELKAAWNNNQELDSWQNGNLCGSWRGLTCDGSDLVTSLWAVLRGYDLNLLLIFILKLIFSARYRKVLFEHLIVKIRIINRWMLQIVFTHQV